MTATPGRQMVLPMTADATPFSTIQDPDNFSGCELRGFHFDTIIIGGRILLYKRNDGYFHSIALEPPSHSN